MNRPTKKDIFDILGISSREDSFTNLFTEAFNDVDNQRFRELVCRELSNDAFSINPTKDCEIRTRCTFNIEKNDFTGDRSKALPDMLLISPDQKKVVVLESKIFSEEGYKQTSTYSSDSFLDELDQMLRKEYDIEGEVEKEFYFLTVSGDTAESDNFKVLRWADLIVHTTAGIQFHTPFDLLMKDLRTRAIELKTFLDTPIDQSKTFNDYYVCQGKWIDNKIIVSKYFGTILRNLNTKYKDKVFYSINKSQGRIPQILIKISSDDWMRYSLEEYCPKDPVGDFEYTRNIHVEFSWQLGEENASIMIHYETNPYYPQQKLKQLYPLIESCFYKHREQFKEKSNQIVEKSKYWTVANTKLALAKISYKNFMNASYVEVEEWFEKVFDEAYEIINECISDE